MHAKLLNLKTSKELLFMQNQTFEDIKIFQDFNINCGMMSLFSNTFKDFSWIRNFWTLLKILKIRGNPDPYISLI